MSRAFLHNRLSWLLGLALSLTGCSLTQPTPYYEQHALKNLTVVFLDEESLRQHYEQIAGQPAVRFTGPSASKTASTTRGFFDFRTNTIYCTKMDFETCGHELHHATLGRFHPDH